MKRIAAWLMLFLLPLFANARTIFTGSTPIDWNNSKFQQVSASEFADVNIADRLVIGITYTGNVSYPQVALINGTTWKSLAGAGNIAITETTSTVEYYLTKTMRDDLKSGGLVISGHGFTLNSVDLEEGDGGAGMENAVWIGNVVMPDDWSAYATIPSTAFTNAKAGDLLRVFHKNVKAGAQVSPRGSDWNNLPGAENKSPEGAYTEYAVTADMLASLQSGGCIIGGCGYTLTSVSVVDPSTIKTLTLNVPVTNNWVFDSTQPDINVEIANGNAEDVSAKVDLYVTTDKFVEYTTLTQTVDIKSGGNKTVKFTFDAIPGFYHVTAIVNDETARAFNIGVNPENIVSPADMQTDFDSFWKKAKDELAMVDINAKLTKIEDKSTDKRNVYLVELNSIADEEGGQPAVIRGYYAEPVKDGKYPTIVHYQGYDSGYDPYCPDGNSLDGYCELYLSTRGQLINNRDPYENTYGDWFQFNFGNKDTYYYRGAYMDVLRAIDFLCSRDKVDDNNLFAEGASQGGAFTYAAAALSDHKIRAIAPAIPFMGDFPDYFEVGSWPAYPAHQQQAALGLSDEEMFAFLSYFDTKNLATKINTPVLSCIGLQDDVCPPHTNIAPYNNLPNTVEKSITFNPELKHQTADGWYNAYMEFFKKHAENKKVEVTTNLCSETIATDNWSGYKKLDASLFSDAKAGDKVVVKVTELDASNANHQVYFQNGSWNGQFYAENIPSDVALPTTVELLLTDDILSTIRGEKEGINSGLVVKGCWYTFSSIDLVRYIDVDPSIEKGNAVTNVWTGNVTISWTTGSSYSEKIDKSKFAALKAGDKIRMTFASLNPGAQGKILHNWTSWDNTSAPIRKLPAECGDYFEYTVTEQMVNDIQKDGLRVSGVGYNLVSVDVIDPAKEYTIISDFEKNDIKAWEKDESPKITLSLQNVEAKEVTIPVVVKLSKDTYEDFKTYSQDVTLKSGEKKSVDVSLDGLEPGFYRMTAKANNNTVMTYYIGYDPTAIGCEDDAPADFWTFWDGWKEKLAAIDIKAELTELTDKSTANRKVYEVKMQSAPDEDGGEPVNIYGYYAEPTSAGTHSCLIRYQGTDNGSGTPTAMGGDDNPEWCELIISTRGQMLSRVKEGNAKYIPEGKTAADFYAYGYGDKDKHYYRAAYLDCVRAIDFVASREAVNKKQIFAAGGSQGGCFTYVAAGLDSRLRAIAPSITGHADFKHTKLIVSWPTNVFAAKQAELGWTDEQIDEFNSYFDTKNFASRITCPVITNFSLQDQTDGPHLNIAPYNLLVNVADADKEYSINPFLGHATPATWEPAFKAFFGKYMETTDIFDIKYSDSHGDDNDFFSLNGIKTGRPTQRGIYINKGKKFIYK